MLFRKVIASPPFAVIAGLVLHFHRRKLTRTRYFKNTLESTSILSKSVHDQTMFQKSFTQRQIGN